MSTHSRHPLLPLFSLLLLHLLQLITELDALHVIVCLPLGLRDLSANALLTHLTLVFQTLHQVPPLEAMQVLQVPQLLVINTPFPPAHWRVVEREGNALCYLFIHEFNPTFRETLTLATAFLLPTFATEFVCILGEIVKEKIVQLNKLQ